MGRLILVITITFFLFSCKSNSHKSEKNTGETYYPKYAKGFYLEGNTLVIRGISNPNTIFAKYTINRNKVVNKIIATSSTHIAMLDLLGVTEDIIGATYINYIKNTTIQKNYKLGKVTELSPQLNESLETLLDLNPGLIVVSPEQYAIVKKQENIGLQYLVNLDYLETTPLARLEWIKVFGYFLNKDIEADKLFENIENKYLDLVDLIKPTTKKTVFSGLPYQGTWFVPGGNSYKANYLKDAGCKYIFGDSISGSVQVDYETILDKASDSDYWEFVISSDSLSYTNLIKEDSRFANFSAIKNKQVVYCNTKKVDFYETGVVEPHIVLADLIHAFLPEFLPKHKSKYYHLLK